MPALTSSPIRLTADTLGIAASTLCFVHCLLTPVLLAASPALAHLLPGEESTHRALAIGIAVLGAVALLRGLRLHRRLRILWLLLAGLACISVGAWFGDRLPSHAAEIAVTLAGSALLITAHRLNHTFCRDCRTCTPPR